MDLPSRFAELRTKHRVHRKSFAALIPRKWNFTPNPEQTRLRISLHYLNVNRALWIEHSLPLDTQITSLWLYTNSNLLIQEANRKKNQFFIWFLIQLRSSSWDRERQTGRERDSWIHEVAQSHCEHTKIQRCRRRYVPYSHWQHKGANLQPDYATLFLRPIPFHPFKQKDCQFSPAISRFHSQVSVPCSSIHPPQILCAININNRRFHFPGQRRTEGEKVRGTRESSTFTALLITQLEPTELKNRSEVHTMQASSMQALVDHRPGSLQSKTLDLQNNFSSSEERISLPTAQFCTTLTEHTYSRHTPNTNPYKTREDEKMLNENLYWLTHEPWAWVSLH